MDTQSLDCHESKAIGERIAILVTAGKASWRQDGKSFDADRLLSGRPGPQEREFLQMLADEAGRLSNATEDPSWRRVRKYIERRYLNRYQTK